MSVNAVNRVRAPVLFFLCLVISLLVPLPAGAQNAFTQSAETVPASYVGLTLSELVQSLGIPQSVRAVRGLEEWQDDVVFVYDEGDFYILENRVWQVGVKSAYNISVGDSEAAVRLALGEAAATGTSYAVFALSGRNWPIAVRVNFDTAGRVTEFFFYRSDL